VNEKKSMKYGREERAGGPWSDPTGKTKKGFTMRPKKKRQSITKLVSALRAIYPNSFLNEIDMKVGKREHLS